MNDDLESQYKAYEHSVRERNVSFFTQEDVDRIFERYGTKEEVGVRYTSFPLPETKEEAFERLENYTGLIAADSNIQDFKRRFPINLRTLRDELKVLTNFIAEAEALSTTEAFRPTGSIYMARAKDNLLAIKHEYLKWKYDYYKNAVYTNWHSFFSDNLILTYGKYFVYKDWIEKEIQKLNTTTQNIDLYKSHMASLQANNEKNPKKDISVFEKFRRELNAIYTIFICQFSDKSNDPFTLLHQDGRICKTINLRSDRALFGMEDFKLHYVTRFENSNKTTVVENELVELYHLAIKISEYYVSQFTADNPRQKELDDNYPGNQFLTIEKSDYHSMIITLVDYEPFYVLFGVNSTVIDARTVFMVRDHDYTYFNHELVEICHELINFINKFEIPRLQAKEEEVLTLIDHLHVEVVHQSDRPEAFANHTIEENPHPDKFIDLKAFRLFEKLHEIYKTTDNPLADYSFIYRQMAEKDHLIIDRFRPEKFRAWVAKEPYNIVIPAKLKTYNNCAPKKKLPTYLALKPLQH